MEKSNPTMPTISHIQSAQLAHLKSTNNDKTLYFMLSEFLSNILDPKFARQSSSKAETIYNFAYEGIYETLNEVV
jgi:hypothetical protein